MKTSCLLWPFLLLVLTACVGERKEAQPEATDTLTVATPDSVPSDSVQPVTPKHLDGLFDDFAFLFMSNSKFQQRRVRFPLPVVEDGKTHWLEKKQWRFDPLYGRRDVYTLIFDSKKAMQAQKDTSLKHVEVEWVYLTARRVKQYVFNKTQGLWRLDSINVHRFVDNENSDFYEFYRQFSSSPDFQTRHIVNPFAFRTYDSDNFSHIDGTLDVQQWPDFRPDLPHGTITNINYGQRYGDARHRLLVICSPSGGMGCTLTFVRKGNTWMLEGLEN